jgi:hypothetical protein
VLRGLGPPGTLRINPESAKSADNEKAADRAGLILSSRCLGYCDANQLRGQHDASEYPAGSRDPAQRPFGKKGAGGQKQPYELDHRHVSSPSSSSSRATAARQAAECTTHSYFTLMGQQGPRREKTPKTQALIALKSRVLRDLTGHTGPVIVWN